MKLVAIVGAVVLAQLGVAAAETPFAVLAAPKAKWTYNIFKGKKDTKKTATLTVTSVHTAGAYTVTEFTLAGDDALAILPQGTWIVGPEGLREVLFFTGTDEGGYVEAHLASAYKDHYVPRAYLPATPAVTKKIKWSLDRFGDEDREYTVTGAITKPDDHTWRTAWKGKSVVPENQESSKYAWSTDFDPAVGFTQICVETGFCLKLAKP